MAVAAVMPEAAAATMAVAATLTACALGVFRAEIPAAQIIWEMPADAVARPVAVTIT